MLKPGLRSLIVLLAIFAFSTCIDPYSPQLTGYESLLVVDGLITDADASYTVKLSKTFQEQNSPPVYVPDAIVYLTDDHGSEINLVNKGKGVYKTDSTEFRGSVGRTYILHVITNDGGVFESDPCLMRAVPDIDSIYFEAGQTLVNNGTEIQKGAQIYLDSKQGDNDQYYRWAFDETWKFRVPNPQKYEYINDSTIPPVAEIKEYCWKNMKSKDILIHSVYAGEPTRIEREPIFFIASEKSDRLMVQYSILVSQFSISKDEYDFWNNMKQINESSGDIFSKQPFSVTSNIHNINNPKERVLGYFQVSAVKQKRKELPFSEILKLDIPFYEYDCERVEKEPLDFQTEWGPIMTWDDVIRIMCVNYTYKLVEPIYVPGTADLSKLVFTMPECANCELTGTSNKPDFWIDLK